MSMQAPVPDFSAARRAMIENQLRPVGVTDQAVLAAMDRVPRERFVADSVAPLAYADRSIAIGNGRFLAAPAVLGQLLTQMAPRGGERALVVGAGTGYSAAVLSDIGCVVTALESDPALALRARDHGLDVVEGPLATGARRLGPFDLILIDGAVEFIPDPLVGQLGDGGRLGAALAERGVTRLVVGRKVGGSFGHLSIGDAGVEILPGFSRPREFTF